MPIKLQTLAEKALLIKNFSECVEVFNKWCKKNQKEEQKKDSKQPKENKGQNDTPQKQPSKMTQKEAEEKLKALFEQEKKLQDKLRKVGAASPEKPEKDW
jgi:hypothetical protein